MRPLISVLVLAAATNVVTVAMQEPAPQRRQQPIVAELSDLLTHSPMAACPQSDRAPARVRVASWNIAAARSAAIDSLASEMRAMQADVIALQEVDVRTKRSGYVDQPTVLAAALGFNYVFAASIHWDEGHYGLALVSKWPLVQAVRHRVAGADQGEPRIILDSTVCVAGRPLRFLNHHADRRSAARALGFADVHRIATAAMGQGVVLLGDMNETSEGAGVRTLLGAGLIDLGASGALNTEGRIDYVFADGPVARKAAAVRVWPSDKSDHNAMFTDLEW